MATPLGVVTGRFTWASDGEGFEPKVPAAGGVEIEMRLWRGWEQSQELRIGCAFTISANVKGA